MEEVKRIPYGISNFIDIIKQNQYYVDKTMFLPLLEDQPSNLFLIRPRRFGKSIFLGMLSAYYDCAFKKRFDELFGNLWIGSHPTRFQGHYQILYFDFSRASTGSGTLEDNFNKYCCTCLDVFTQKYAHAYEEDFVMEMKNRTSAADKLNYLNLQAQALGNHLYLIIDEYDNFTNVVLSERGEAVYRTLTHASGFYRDAFKLYKGMFERIFMMGVSPVTLDDLTSGFNIGWNISTDPQFNRMLGFSEQEVREMFQYYQDAGSLQGNIDSMIEEIKPWYDNYCFAKECLTKEPKMFNCDMVLYYLRNRIALGKSPEQMVDPNTRTDYNKLKKLLDLDHLDGDRKGIIRKIASEGQIITNLITSFPAKDLVNPELFPSQLFYYGMLTITGIKGNRLVLGIPNNNVRKQYYEYMFEQYQGKERVNLDALGDLFDNMVFQGKWRPVIEKIAEDYKNNSSVRSSIEGERNIQGFFNAYLNLNTYYQTAPEVELNHGYCDLFLIPDRQRYPDVAHSYIIELKYLAIKNAESQAECQWNEAVEQVRRYAESERIRILCHGTRLHKLIVQFKGWELVRAEEV